MAGEALTPEALRATWAALPDTTRTTITAALIAAADAELRRIDRFYPSSSGDVPAVEVLGVLTDPGGGPRVHFFAHHLNYNFAQSGSDWADHYVLAGNAVLAGETLGTIALEMAVHNGIREHDWDDYRDHSRDQIVEATRSAVIAQLCASSPAHAAPPREMESVTIVRCPCCGATNAGASEDFYELTCMTCQVCGHSQLCDHEQIKDDWNVKHEHPHGAITLPPFVPLRASSAPGFDLTGDVNDETRLLVHPGLDYAIAIPGGPRQIAPIGGTHTASAVLELAAAVTVVVRAQLSYAMIPCDGHLRRELESAAQLRAKEGSALELVHAGRLGPPGANASMYVSYPARGETDDAMELLSLTLKGEHPSYRAVYVNVRYRTSKLDPFAWANLRTALLAHQTWKPGELPALPVWPPTSTFAEPTLLLPLTKRASDAAVAKAAELSAMPAADAQRLIEWLLASASTDDPPTTPWHPLVTQLTSQKLLGCVPASLAEVLVRDLAEVQSMLDFRAWCKGCLWAVQSREAS